jgi:hypothetical protein
MIDSTPSARTDKRALSRPKHIVDLLTHLPTEFLP